MQNIELDFIIYVLYINEEDSQVSNYHGKNLPLHLLKVRAGGGLRISSKSKVNPDLNPDPDSYLINVILQGQSRG